LSEEVSSAIGEILIRTFLNQLRLNIEIAHSRVERLYKLLEFQKKPKDLHVISCLGYIDSSLRKRCDLLLQSPTNEISTQPLVVHLQDLRGNIAATGK
jgi:hypothetical protein